MEKEYDVWLGVRLSVVAGDSEESELRATEWVRATLQSGERNTGVIASAEPINLAPVAVRVLNLIGEEKCAQEEQASSRNG